MSHVRMTLTTVSGSLGNWLSKRKMTRVLRRASAERGSGVLWGHFEEQGEEVVQ